MLVLVAANIVFDARHQGFLAIGNTTFIVVKLHIIS
jgi:hypothetical protein